MTPEQRAKNVCLQAMWTIPPWIYDIIVAAIRAAERDATQERLLDMLDALRLVKEDTCSLHCPSVKKEGDEWTHSERCKTISQVIAKAEADIQIVSR